MVIEINGYRQNVLAIIFNTNGECFIGKNSWWGQDWTFPKGWIEIWESATDALYREIYEETWLIRDTLKVLCKMPTTLKKTFSKQELEWKIKNKKEYFIWKEDHIFILRYDDKWEIDLNITKELLEYKWISLTDIKMYIDNMTLLSLINIPTLKELIQPNATTETILNFQ